MTATTPAVLLTREGRSWVIGSSKPTPTYLRLVTRESMVGRPRAAKGMFPYQHLTCAEWA